MDTTKKNPLTRDGRHSARGGYQVTSFGPFRGWFATATSIAVDRAGNVFVADFGNNRIQKWRPRAE